jgi:hypothetical protein
MKKHSQKEIKAGIKAGNRLFNQDAAEAIALAKGGNVGVVATWLKKFGKESYDMGFDEGHEEGYNAGHEDGHGCGLADITACVEAIADKLGVKPPGEEGAQEAA